MTRFPQNPLVSDEIALSALDFFDSKFDILGTEQDRSGLELKIKDPAAFQGFMRGLSPEGVK